MKRVAAVLAVVILATAGAATAGGAVPAAAEQTRPPEAAAQPSPYRAHRQLAPLEAERAWRYATGAGVVVAVLDSGVDADHPDLAGRVREGADFVDGSTDGREDPVGHGTTVASLVAGAGDRATGLAPDATVLPVRVLDEDNRYRNAGTVADGVRWAADHGADIINLSLGGHQASASLREAVSYALARDVVVVACTGNLDDGERDAEVEVWYPAREPGVVAVAGLRYGRGAARAWRPSVTGPATVLAAPAVVVGADAGGGRRSVQGTSFAAALVTGAAALVREARPGVPAADVINRLVGTAEDLGRPGRDPVYGFGEVDPVAALTTALPPAAANPLDTTARLAVTGFGGRRGPAPASPVPPVTTPVGPRPEGVTTAGRAAPAAVPAGIAGALLVAAAALGLAAALIGRDIRVRVRYRRRYPPAPSAPRPPPPPHPPPPR